MKTLEKVSDFVGKYMRPLCHCGGGTVSAVPRHLQCGKDCMGQHPAGHRHVRHGSYPEAGGLQGGVQPPERRGHWLHCAVHPDALPCMGADAAVPPATELAIGVILVGTCPGGTSSNVMTYLSKGDVALSVGMTAVSTVLAPILTPLLTLLYAGQRVDVNPVNMFLSIVKVVLVPIALGFVVNHFFHAFTQNAVRVLPLVSTTAIVLIICAVVSANSAKIMTSGLLILP